MSDTEKPTSHADLPVVYEDAQEGPFILQVSVMLSSYGTTKTAHDLLDIVRDELRLRINDSVVVERARIVMADTGVFYDVGND